ncbi:uncharacterized protein [Antedon mediterranea]|uniref:uncharacterized protein n=1 Tax=Antedon mediterranea TaxID=105859 RepID=UPI003AF8DE1A
MDLVTFQNLMLKAVLVLLLLQWSESKSLTSWICPKSCVCTPEGTAYCNTQNIISVTPTIPSKNSQTNLFIKGQNLFDKRKHRTNNKLRTLFKDVLQQMPTSNIIDISNNKLHCDCEILWLKKWLIDNETNKILLSNTDYICYSPPILKGQRVKDIDSAVLNCPVEEHTRWRRKASRRRRPRTYTSKPLDLCFVNHCKNNGTCVLQDGQSLCMCPLSYTGEICEIRSEPHLQIYAKQLIDRSSVQVNWTLDREAQDIQFKLETKTADGIRLIQSQMLPGQMRHVIVAGPFLTTRVRVCLYIYENNIITNILSCKKIYIDERGYGLPPPSDLPDDKIYNPYDASNFNEVIDKASIALGSIIGLCGLLILGLAIAYKNRQIDSDTNANMAADMNGLGSAYGNNTIIQLQTIRESYEEEVQEATLADASQVPIVAESCLDGQPPSPHLRIELVSTKVEFFNKSK